MVGFLMHCIDADDGQHWIYRLMIADAYQGKGYAYEAMKLVLAEIRADRTRDRVYLDCKHENTAAQKLYEKLGFKRTDEFDDKEVYYRLDY